jgi:hypothetical protein
MRVPSRTRVVASALLLTACALDATARQPLAPPRRPAAAPTAARHAVARSTRGTSLPVAGDPVRAACERFRHRRRAAGSLDRSDVTGVHIGDTPITPRFRSTAKSTCSRW